MYRSILCAPLLALALTACGGDDGSSLAGFYEITTHTHNDASCEAEGAAVTEYSHFRLKLDEFFGQSFLALDECTAALDESCSDLGFFRAFVRTDGEWEHVISSSSFGGSSCYLGYVYGTIIEEDEAGAIRIEIRGYSQDDATVGEEQCTPEEAERRGTEMPCDDYEVFAGTLLP